MKVTTHLCGSVKDRKTRWFPHLRKQGTKKIHLAAMKSCLKVQVYMQTSLSSNGRSNPIYTTASHSWTLFKQKIKRIWWLSKKSKSSFWTIAPFLKLYVHFHSWFPSFCHCSKVTSSNAQGLFQVLYSGSTHSMIYKNHVEWQESNMVSHIKASVMPELCLLIPSFFFQNNKGTNP